MTTESRSNDRELSGRVCGALSMLVGAGAIWIFLATARDGGEWYFSVLALIAPLLFAFQGLRLSREAGTKWPLFSRITSIIGIVLGAVAFVGFLYLLSVSTSA